MQEVIILGSTGTIGVNSLDVISGHKNKFKIKALSSNSNVELLVEQAKKFNVEYVAIADEGKYQQLKEALPNCEVLAGGNAALEIAKLGADILISAIVGFAALAPTMEAIKTCKRIGLANKESLVCAGELMMKHAKQNGTKIIPIDSEHNAIYQVFDFENPSNIDKVVLTASGGPFRELSLSEFKNITPEMAVAHPNWEMGKKISVDSATMMNKGLELIEAKYLFELPDEKLEAIIHPESFIHAFVHYKDGAVLAQGSVPDMRIPISYALGYPDRLENSAANPSLTQLGKLHFEEIDYKRFPCFELAVNAMEKGGAMPTVLNAANEIAVEKFLRGQIGFVDIAKNVEAALSKAEQKKITDITDIFEIDAQTRSMAIDS